jgi:hypothetical protein
LGPDFEGDYVLGFVGLCPSDKMSLLGMGQQERINGSF